MIFPLSMLLLATGVASSAGALQPPARYESLEIVYALGPDQEIIERRSGEIQLFDTPAFPVAKGLVVPLLNSRGAVCLERLVRVNAEGVESPIKIGEAVHTGSFLFWETPGVEPGDRIQFSVEQPVDVDRHSGQWWFSGRIAIPLPVRQGILTLSRESGFAGSVAVSYKGHQAPSAGIDSWILDDQPATNGTWRFTVSSFPDWRTLGAWVAGFCDASPGDQFTSFGQGLSTEVPDPLERALRLADRLSLRLRVWDGSGRFNYACRPVEETMREGRANRLEAQAALVALFTSQGISAERFLTFPEPGNKPAVRPESADRALVRVVEAGRTLWFDVAKLSEASGAVSPDHGSALRISQVAAEWVPFAPERENLQPGIVVAELDVSIDSIGLLQANLSLTATGTPGRPYRSAFDSTREPDALRERYSTFLKELQNVSRPTVTNLDRPNHPFEAFVPFRKEDVLLPFRRRENFAFNAVPLAREPRPLEDGRLWLGVPGLYKEEISVRFPPNFKVTADIQVDKDRGFAVYRSRAKVVDGELRITRALDLRRGVLEADERDRARQLALIVARDQEVRFQVQRYGRAHFDEWLQNVPVYSAIGLAGLASDEDEYELAFRLYEIAFQENPRNDYYWNDLAADLQRVGRFSESVDALKKQIELNPDSRHAYNNLAIENMRTGDYEMALANFQKQLQISPGNKGAIGAIPDILFLMGRWSEAEKAALRAAKALNDPDFETGAALLRICSGSEPDPATPMPGLGPPLDFLRLVSLAELLSSCGRGLEWAQRSIDIAFDHLGKLTVPDAELMTVALNRQGFINSFLLSQARVLKWKGQTERAAEVLGDLVALGFLPEAFYESADLEWKLGRKERALELWQQARAMKPDLRWRIPREAAPQVEALPAVSLDGVWYPMEDLEQTSEHPGPSGSPTYYYVVANPDGTVLSARPLERADQEADNLIPAIRRLVFARFRVRGEPIQTVHLLKCVPLGDGKVAVYRSTSTTAMRIVSALAPEEFPRLPSK